MPTVRTALTSFGRSVVSTARTVRVLSSGITPIHTRVSMHALARLSRSRRGPSPFAPMLMAIHTGMGSATPFPAGGAVGRRPSAPETVDAGAEDDGDAEPW